MDPGSSPLSGLRVTRSKRHSPLYPASRRNSPGAEMMAPSRTTKTTRLSIRDIADDDDSDDDPGDGVPQLSALAQMLLEEKAEMAMGNGTEVEVPRTGKKIQWGKTPDVRTIERRNPGSSSSAERSSPTYSSRLNESDLMTPAPKARPGRRPIGTTLSSSGSNDSSEHKDGELDRSYYTGPSSVARPSTIATTTASAVRWKRSTALAGAPRRGPRRDSSAEQYEGHASEIVSPVDQEDETPAEQGAEAERERESSMNSGYRNRTRESLSGSGLYGRRASPASGSSHSRELEPDPPRESSPIQDYTPRDESPPPQPKASSTLPIRAFPPTLPTLPSLPVNNKENVAPAAISRAASYQNRSSNEDRNILANSPSRKRSMQVPSPPEMAPEKPPVLATRNSNTPLRPAPPPPPPKMSMMDAAASSAGAATTATNGSFRKSRQTVVINGRQYQRLMNIGKGGSSKVYKVMAENYRMFAVKKVTFHKEDGEAAIAGYKGEIQLLQKLADVDRVVRLFDWEINDRKQCLTMLMECGETDLAKLLAAKNSGEDARLDVNFIRFYWREMLQCVQAVHALNIIHSDLKPANFLLVQGRLKLIDFGIANAIQDDTVNVHRESQVGTVNYMAPETLMDVNASSGRAMAPVGGPKLHKLGAPSDVWSLGCMLYQMVYGRTPFAHIKQILEKVQAITNPRYQINYPSTGIGGVPVPRSLIRTIEGCLQRDKNVRPTIAELLSDEDRFMNPDQAVEGMVDISLESLKRLLENCADHCQKEGIPDKKTIASWAEDVYGKLERRMYETRTISKYG